MSDKDRVKPEETASDQLSESELEQASGGFRPNPAGDGTTEHFFTVEIREGRIADKTPGKKLTE